MSFPGFYDRHDPRLHAIRYFPIASRFEQRDDVDESAFVERDRVVAPAIAQGFERIRLAGLAVPFNVRSSVKFDGIDDHPYYHVSYERGAFSEFLSSDYDCALVVGGHEADARVLSRSIELFETQCGLAFAAANVDLDDESIASVRRGSSVPVSALCEVDGYRWLEPPDATSTLLVTCASVVHVAIVKSGAFLGACRWLG